MELPKPSHQNDFACQIRDLISNSNDHPRRRRCTEAALIRPHRDLGMDHIPTFSALTNVYGPLWDPAELMELSKVVKASEFNAAETDNKCIDPSLSIQENNDGGSVYSDYMDKHHGIDWHRPCCEIITRISTSVAYLHAERNASLCHEDLKPRNVLLEENMVPKLGDFGISRHSVEEERTPTMKSCIEKSGYMDPEYIERSVISKKSTCIFLSAIFLLGTMIEQFTDIVMSPPVLFSDDAQKHWRKRLQPPQMWMLESSSKQIKRLNQIVLSCLETGKSMMVMGSTASSVQRAAHDKLVLDSGGVNGAMVDCNTAPNKDVLLVLALFVTVLAVPSMHQHLFWSNQTEEQSDEARSNRAPATNSSDKTTRTPMENKPTDHEAENHRDPNSCIAERDRIPGTKRSGDWYVATGAAHHATGNPDLITNLVELESDGLCVHAADGTPMPVRGRGNVVTENVVLPDVYYVPGLHANLVSVGQLAGLNYCVSFGRGACVISDANGAVVGRAHSRGDGLYEVDFLRM